MRTSPRLQPAGWRMLKRMSTVSVNAACAAANDIAAGASPASRTATGSTSHSSALFVPISHTRPRRRRSPPRCPASARSAVCPVLSALERSTDSAPSTTQKECWTLLRSADQHREPEPDGAAQAVLQPHRVPLEVRARALLGGRQRAREARRGRPSSRSSQVRRSAAAAATDVAGDLERRRSSAPGRGSSGPAPTPPPRPSPAGHRAAGWSSSARAPRPRRAARPPRGAAGPARGRGGRAGRRLRRARGRRPP